MTNEQLEQGNKLNEQLQRLITQKKLWEESTSFYRIELKRPVKDIDLNFVDFDYVKYLTIRKIQERINELQKEFNTL